MINNNYYHPKAAFSLFLNQAENNVEIAAKIILNIKPSAKGDNFINIIKKISNKLNNKSQLIELKQKHFRFLQNLNINDFENSKNLFLDLLDALNNIRNYYSHFYYLPEVKGEFEIKENIKVFLNELFKQSKLQIIEKYDIDENCFEKYNLFNEENSKTTITAYGKVFLINLFLNKRQANLLVSSINGLKGNSKKEFKATRECFINYCLKKFNSDFNTDNSHAQFFFDAIAHLSKIPKIVEDNLTSEYKNKLKDEENNTRTSKDKFTYFALRYIDDFALLPDVKFKVYIRTFDSENNEIREEKYLNLEERKKYFENFNSKSKNIAEKNGLIFEEQNYNLYDYVIKNKNVLFEIDNSEFTSWVLTTNDFKKLRAKLKADFTIQEKANNPDSFNLKKAIEIANKKADDLILILNPHPKKKKNNNSQKQLKNYFFNDETELRDLLNEKIKKNKILTNIHLELLIKQAEKKLKGSISIHELRNFVFSFINDEKYITQIFKNYLNTYRNFYKKIIKDENISYTDIKKQFITNVNGYLFFEKELPKSIKKHIKQNNNYDENYWKNFIENLVKFNENNKCPKNIENEIIWNIINIKNFYVDIVKGKTENLEKLEIVLKEKANITNSKIKEKIQNWVCRELINREGKTEKDNVSYYSAVQKKEILVRLYNLKESISKSETKNKFQIINSIIKIITDFKLKPNKELSNTSISKKDFDKDWYEKIQIALGNKTFVKENIFKQIETNADDVLNFKESLKNSDNLGKFYHSLQTSYISWCNDKINEIENNSNPDKWKKTAKFLGIHKKHQNNERIADIATEYFNIISIPRGFITHTKKYHTSIEEHKKRKEENKHRSKLSELIDKRLNNIEIPEFYKDKYKTNEAKADQNLYQKINEEKQKDKVLLLIANEYLKKKITGSELLKNKPKIENLLTEGNITLNIENKNITFKINDYHKINQVLNDKKKNKIFKNYVQENTIEYKDLNEILTKIENEQKVIVNNVLKLEKQILLNYLIKKTYNCNKHKNIAEYQIDIENRKNINLNLVEFKLYNYEYKRKFNNHLKELIHSDKNRIETVAILKKINIEENKIDLSKIPEGIFRCNAYKREEKKLEKELEKSLKKNPNLKKLIVLILYYRNAAFHNNIPEFGTFEDGILLLNTELKNKLK